MSSGAPDDARADQAPGLALETATEHVSVAVVSSAGATRALVEEDVGHGHTRRLAALVERALRDANVRPADIGFIATDLGPGSFTGVRVGLATARALALVSGARLLGASSLAALAHATSEPRTLVVPLVGAGRRDLYAGFFRIATGARVRLIAAPRVGPPETLLEALAEVHALVPDHEVRFVGPGAGRERARLEDAYPGSTGSGLRFEGLSALDLAAAALKLDGPGSGLPEPGREMEPAYVRPAQAEERVRHKVTGLTPARVRALVPADLPRVDELEHRLFADPWPRASFLDALAEPSAVSLVAERGGSVAGYLVATVLPPVAELQNLGTAPEQQRAGVARALVDALLETCRVRGVRELGLEVRVSNAAAQALYRTHGFRLVGLRRGYYKRPEEDALLMARRV
ncbi:MAG TPA: tRNA (adenosine(37)-N6)-threonylcarbamoyltransferase complex dimerization subunit type 1 TsaB [Methylomirabilota bacterium]|nr:tRNA (adenosine(37)-N6)-threonylcarbamoyltransferase complex dimerization subunit type 1 TsaB [Methylomirabilota bacterium]